VTGEEIVEIFASEREDKFMSRNFLALDWEIDIRTFLVLKKVLHVGWETVGFALIKIVLANYIL